MKPIAFLGSSLDDLRGFPGSARRDAGHQLDRVQRGFDPTDWKPMPAVGPGVREIRIRDAAGAFRVIYTVSRPEAVYVLHAFQKKSQQAARRDLDLAEDRLRGLVRRAPE
ncbi:MAG: type II toxin-antitoxin system RelE/ParE family toxin [Alphaproteobacteria bacterium]|nr:type II toxin-antitoxin system RelE/ParE family toxin [Alphaproteobacteria bacterium]